MEIGVGELIMVCCLSSVFFFCCVQTRNKHHFLWFSLRVLWKFLKFCEASCLGVQRHDAWFNLRKAKRKHFPSASARVTKFLKILTFGDAIQKKLPWNPPTFKMSVGTSCGFGWPKRRFNDLQDALLQAGAGMDRSIRAVWNPRVKPVDQEIPKKKWEITVSSPD